MSKEEYRIKRNILIWSAIILNLINNFVVLHVVDEISIIIYILIDIIIGILILIGCYMWTKYKNRSEFWCLFAFLGVIGFIVLACLEDRNILEIKE